MGRELKGSTLGVIGYGQIGRYLCDLCLGFGMRVVVADPHAKVDDPRVTKLEVMELLAQSDFVVCLAPATTDTENLMNAQAFAKMKPTTFFINASRGELVDEAALADALDAGRDRRLRAGRWPSPGPDAYAGIWRVIRRFWPRRTSADLHHRR